MVWAFLLGINARMLNFINKFMTIKKWIFILCCSATFNSFGQDYTISGYVTDETTGEILIGASLYDTVSKTGTVSNTYGFYSISLKTDTAYLRVSYLGYNTLYYLLKNKKESTHQFLLTPATSSLSEIKVIGIKDIPIEQSTIMGLISIPINQIKKLPSIGGETDVLKTLQLLPGVQSGNEGSTGLFVRGGTPDQNLILLDGVPVYNISHLFGFFSVITPEAINKVDLIKGSFPARYGGRLSSVIDITMKEGNLKKFSGSCSIGLISSRLTFEGPIWKNKTSFLINVRRTYIDLLARPFTTRKEKLSNGESKSTGGYYFYDLNGKINHTISEKDKLFFSVYAGKDVFYSLYKEQRTSPYIKNNQNLKNSLGWGNITSILRWNHILIPKIFLHTSFAYSSFKFETATESKNTTEFTKNPADNSSSHLKFSYISNIADVIGNIDLDYFLNSNHSIKVGGSYTYHRFNPGINVLLETKSNHSFLSDTTLGNKPLLVPEINLYVEDDFSIGNVLKANLGLHYTTFIVNSKTYHSLQPRILSRFMLTEHSSLKLSFCTNQQFIHLLTNSGVGLPTDIWVPSTQKVRPQQSQQYAVGLARTIYNYELSIESYYKTMQNVLEYKEGFNFLNGGAYNWEQSVESGRGEAYGIEFFAQKKEGKTTGWIGYTLAWNYRTFKSLNEGKAFPFKYDRRHDISIVVIHKFNDRIDVSGSWVFGSGNAITLPTQLYKSVPGNYEELFTNIFSDQYIGDASLVDYIPSRNNARMRSYHRLDLSVNLIKKKKRGIRTWNFSIYNVYGRQNPLYYYYKTDTNGTRTILQYSLFSIIPSVSYSFNF